MVVDIEVKSSDVNIIPRENLLIRSKLKKQQGDILEEAIKQQLGINLRADAKEPFYKKDTRELKPSCPKCKQIMVQEMLEVAEVDCAICNKQNQVRNPKTKWFEIHKLVLS